MRKLINKIIKEDNFLSLSGNLTIAVFGFAGFSLLARSLSPHDFGQWVLFISGGSFILMLRNGITRNAIVRFLSGAKTNEEESLIGANTKLSLIATLIMSTILILVYAIWTESIEESGYGMFFKWYPVLAIVNLPFSNALLVLEAKLEYGKILLIRFISTTFFFMFLVVNFFVLNYSIQYIVIAYVFFNAITSFYCIFKSWDGLIHIRKANKKSLGVLLNFGKYSTFTSIGSNLLKNADVFIISISPFGSTAVALFSIPLKLTEIQQIPLRSFVATAYPKMSKASIEGNFKKLRDLFNTYSGALIYLFFFISVITFVFAEIFVILISGDQYLDAEFYGIDIVMIVKIFSIYGLFLPLDRMTGVGLDSINKPNINALKVIIMLTANVIGDLVAIYLFESIEMVAVVTLIFTLIGILIGIHYLNKSFSISFAQVFKSGNEFYRMLFLKAFKIT